MTNDKAYALVLKAADIVAKSKEYDSFKFSFNISDFGVSVDASLWKGMQFKWETFAISGFRHLGYKPLPETAGELLQYMADCLEGDKNDE